MSLETKPSPHETSRGKPALVYIMILFIAAFLLMALSFAAHQRSNEEALGDLESSVHATLKDIQAEQARLPEITAENAALKSQITEIQQQLEQVSADLGSTVLSLEAAQEQLRAMEQLCSLQQQYAEQNYTACAELIKTMEADGTETCLPTTQKPLFLEIKQAVTAALAVPAETALEEK